VGGQRHAPATLPPVPIVQGGAPGPVWTGAENLASTGIRSPDRPARSESLIPTELSRHTGTAAEDKAHRRRTDRHPRGQPHSTGNNIQRHIARAMTSGNNPCMGLQGPMAP